jgi:hypothetical protein
MIYVQKLLVALIAPPFLLALFASLAICPSAATAQSTTTTIGEIAADVSKTIRDSSKPVSGMPIVAVNDLKSQGVTSDSVAAGFTKLFREALARSANGFQIIDGSAYAQQLRMAPPQESSDSAAEACQSKSPAIAHENFELYGFVEQRGDSVMLWIKVTRLVKVKLVFDSQFTVAVTPETRSAAAQAATDSETTFDEAKDIVWTRPDFEMPPSLWDFPSMQGRRSYDNYTWPTSIRRESAPYTDAAVNEKVKGAVFLKVFIDDEGRPDVIVLFKGIPCDFGLNQAAIDATTHWRMTPARDPNGSPTPSWVEVEQTFDLY